MAWPAIAMLALTGAKMVSDADREQRQRKLASETQRYSPWTKLQAGEIEEADPAGTAAQGLGGYMGYEQAQENAELRKNLLNAQIGALNRSNGGTVVSPMLVEQPRGYSQADYWSDRMNGGDPYSYLRGR